MQSCKSQVLILQHLDLSAFLLQQQLLRQPLALQHLDLLGLPRLLLLQCLVALTKHLFLLPDGWEGALQQFCKGLAHCFTSCCWCCFSPPICFASLLMVSHRRPFLGLSPLSPTSYSYSLSSSFCHSYHICSPIWVTLTDFTIRWCPVLRLTFHHVAV